MKKPSTLTDEERKKMEENRQKAIEKRKLAMKRAAEAKGNASTSGTTSAFNEKDQPVKPNYAKVIPSSLPTSKPVFSNGKSIHGTFSMINRQKFKIEVSFHAQVIEIFKSVQSRIYDMPSKTWNFAIGDHSTLVNKLKALAPFVTFTVLPNHIIKTFTNAGETRELREYNLSRLNVKLRESLLPFQKEGVYFGIRNNGRVLIADDMGLGKTIQGIAIACYYRNEWPVIIVCPSSVRYSWRQAFFEWMPELNPADINIVNTAKDKIDWGQVVILSYDMVSKRKDEIEKMNFKIVIADESHFLKNFKSARTKAVQNAVRKANRIILLTGTPALSRPLELFTQITMVKPGFFCTFAEFGIRYCGGRLMPWGWDYSRASNMTELHLILEETIMIRRLKSEVITQLPAKRRQVIMLDPANIKVNRKVFDQYSKEMANVNLKGAQKRGVLLQFFNETGATKTKAVCDYLSDLLEADNKFICFAHHQIMMDAIAQMLESKSVSYMRIDGRTQSEARKLNCDRFQMQDSCRVALLSITAANAGISLTATSLVVFAELFWNPGILTQAEDRAHRIGQRDSVIVQYLVAEGTADDLIWPLIQQKLDVLSKAGLSKDNFKDSDTINMASECKIDDQKLMDEFLVKYQEQKVLGTEEGKDLHDKDLGKDLDDEDWGNDMDDDDDEWGKVFNAIDNDETQPNKKQCY